MCDTNHDINRCVDDACDECDAILYGAGAEAEAEAVIDRRVQRRLANDSAYRNAENAEQQSQREDEITREEEDKFYYGRVLTDR